MLDCVARLRTAVAEGQTIDPQALAELAREADRADIAFLRTEIPLAISQSLEGVERVSRIVRAMKEFSHPSEAKVAVDLNRAIETTMIVAQNELKYVAETRTNLDPQLPLRAVPAWRSESGRAQSARSTPRTPSPTSCGDAGREGPDHGLDPPRSTTGPRSASPTPGRGIPETAQRRIFDPFFTTKEVGRGTGQGLALAHAVIVKKHRGHIWFETAIGRGTTFFVRLPLVVEPEQPATS